MIAVVNEELYRLGERDRAGQMLAPYFGSRTLAFAIGASQATVDIIVPQDRIVCLQTAVFLCAVTDPLTKWTGVAVRWRPNESDTSALVVLAQKRNTGAGAALVPLQFDGCASTAIAGQGGTIALIDRHLTCPPGGVFSLAAWRDPAATTAATECVCWFHAWAIPAANVGRLS